MVLTQRRKGVESVETPVNLLALVFCNMLKLNPTRL